MLTLPNGAAARLRRVAILMSCASPCLAQVPGQAARVAAAVDATALYTDACAPCHGSAGDGQGSGARALGTPRPRDFTAGVFKFRSTPTGSLPSDDDLFRTISRGVPGTWMVAWEPLLSQAERWALVRYVKGFSALFEEESPDRPIPIPPPVPSSPELVGEGRAVYAMLRCAQCHGPGGRGDGPSAHELTDDWGDRIRPYDLRRGAYRNGGSPDDVYRTLVTGLNGTPMPALDPSAVAFPGGPDADLAAVERELPAPELALLRAYLAAQPSTRELGRLAAEQRAQIVERRLWSLVYYLRSLTRSSGVAGVLRGNPDLAGEVARP